MRKEVKLAMEWATGYCKEGIDVNAEENQRSLYERAKLWEMLSK